jgi:hypothetical protein
MTGMVSVDTCCPGGAEGQPPAESSIGEPGCCERFVVANAKPAASPPAVARDGLLLHSVRVAFLPSVSVLTAPDAGRAALRGDTARIPKPPLRLLKRSLLI